MTIWHNVRCAKVRKSACMKHYTVACKFLQVATNTIEQLAMQQKCFGRAEILCKVPFVKCMQVAENGKKKCAVKFTKFKRRFDRQDFW